MLKSGIKECFFSDVKKITCLTIQLTVGFLSPDNGGTEGGVKTIEYFMYVRLVETPRGASSN